MTPYAREHLDNLLKGVSRGNKVSIHTNYK